MSCQVNYLTREKFFVVFIVEKAIFINNILGTFGNFHINALIMTKKWQLTEK